jgi:hypothetical protein
VERLGAHIAGCLRGLGGELEGPEVVRLGPQDGLGVRKPLGGPARADHVLDQVQSQRHVAGRRVDGRLQASDELSV